MTRPGPSAVPITLDDVQRRVLMRRATASTAAVRDVLRARVVLAAADGATNARIAASLQVTCDTVRKWRNRFAANGMKGLQDRPRSGRPPTFTAVEVAEVKRLACTPPEVATDALARWSRTELAVEAVQRGLVGSISPATVGRWLDQDAIKPWRYRSWIFRRDPDFHNKAAAVLDLYDRIWDGQGLGADEFVLSADEKSQLQALHRRHRTRPAGPAHPAQVEFEYRRGGTLAYFAGYDVHRAHVHGRIEPKTGIDPFRRLVEQVMTREPYRSAARVFWVVDNGSSHQGPNAVARIQAAWPTARLVHLPVHASWLNQVEIYFSILQRKAINPADFRDLAALETRILAFQRRYNRRATPFNWRYRRSDLTATLNRIPAAA